MTEIDALDAAYRATRYIVEDNEPIALCIGETSAALDALFARRNAASGVFITAWNPGSRCCTQRENEEAAERLEIELRRTKLVFLPARAVPDDPDWPIEAGRFVLDLTAGAALRLAEQFGQNAVVIAGRSSPLLLLKTRLMRY
jgi:hypothetical protein